VICLLNNNLVSNYFWQFSQEANIPGACSKKQYCHNTCHEKLKGLCKTRWVERLSYLETFGEIYEYVVTCLDATVNPHVCPEVNESRGNGECDTKIALIVGKVVCRVLELLLASQYWRKIWIILKICQLNYK